MTLLSAPIEESVHEENNHNSSGAVESPLSSLSLPNWVSEKRAAWGERLAVAEWEEHDDDDDANNYRIKNGWGGQDLVHDRNSPVRVVEYYVSYGNGIKDLGLDKGGINTTLTGIVHFTPRAESHRRFCHGGSMCSVMDDVIGWCAFLVTGSCRPWSGFTVQINTSLKKPIMINSVLLIQAKIVNVERRKVSIHAELLDPAETVTSAIHATGEGLVVLNKGILPEGSKS